MKFTQPTPQQIKILKFLRVETFSTPQIIQLLMQQTTIQASYRILNRMVTQKLLTKYTLPIVCGRGVLLYGISNFGLAYAFDLDETPSYRPTFQPSKVSAVTLQHKLDIQMIHVNCIHAGWKNWRDGSQLGFRGRNQKIPDAVAIDLERRKIAVEIEREIKSAKRYRSIILSHLVSRKHGHWDSIIYLCPTSDLAIRLKRVFENLGSLNYNGKKITLTRDHLKCFKFLGYDTFSKFIATRCNETPNTKNNLHTV
jgi:hypothetical protein